MKTHTRRFFFLFLLCLVALPTGFVRGAEYTFDKAHSSFRFGVRHVFSTVYGQFDDYDGKIVFDPAHPEQAVFDFTVAVKSLQTGVGKRDQHLLSKEFFDVGSFPKITFRSTSVRQEEDGKLLVSGSLTMKGRQKNIVLPVHFLGVKNHPLEKSKSVAGFEFRTTLNRLAYGVGSGRFAQMGVVDDDVEVFVSLEMLTDR